MLGSARDGISTATLYRGRKTMTKGLHPRPEARTAIQLAPLVARAAFMVTDRPMRALRIAADAGSRCFTPLLLASARRMTGDLVARLRREAFISAEEAAHARPL